MSVGELIKLNYEVAALVALGYTLNDLRSNGCTVAKLKRAFPAAQLREAGFSLEELVKGGCSLKHVFKAVANVSAMAVPPPSPAPSSASQRELPFEATATIQALAQAAASMVNARGASIVRPSRTPPPSREAKERPKVPGTKRSLKDVALAGIRSRAEAPMMMEASWVDGGAVGRRRERALPELHQPTWLDPVPEPPDTQPLPGSCMWPERKSKKKKLSLPHASVMQRFCAAPPARVMPPEPARRRAQSTGTGTGTVVILSDHLCLGDKDTDSDGAASAPTPPRLRMKRDRRDGWGACKPLDQRPFCEPLPVWVPG